MAVQEASQTVRAMSYRRPKTILGFFAIIFAILSTTASVIIGVLSGTESLHSAIPWILFFLAIFAVAMVVGVFVTAWKDPTILMLGQVSGQDYIANRRLTLGDSDQGEYIEISHVNQSEVPVVDQPTGLPTLKTSDGVTNGE